MSDTPTLLLVDDDSFVRRILKDVITDTGIDLRVLEAADGEEGLAVAEREQPAVMFLDLFMPKKSGLEVLGAIKHVSPGTRVLVISSMDAEPVVEQAISAGAVGFVGKPFHPLEIASAVRQALAH
ncbi:response regulator [Corallococcus sp. H22C18031201]|uniref:response regulator n=1 Tax=Citreicoccus inhibens TaxID=2849499 RepID=UPI000E748E46|nr:response regulator [Citreicoccus inhibens]MBJ6759609.1 response regulator [Myxococcaceae bacterium JPH2]MBU8896220.1 response regulator [Citreicoccus inhibens]RJS26086.1 response regulator [Corallococcus sp. H22C18031201]